VPNPRIIAHRGASGHAPENTLAAIHRAFELGADGVEVDLHLTRDEVPVLIHDPNTLRVSGQNYDVASTEFATLRRLDVGAPFDPAFKGEKIPTLDEVVNLIPPRRYLFIEIKDVPAGKVARALQKIFTSDATLVADHQVFLMSFYPDVLWPLAARFPDLTLLLLLDDLRRLPRKIPPRLPHDTLPVHGLGLSAHLQLGPEQRKRLADAGALLNIWTVNDPSAAVDWRSYDFVTTDYPDRFARSLESLTNA